MQQIQTEIEYFGLVIMSVTVFQVCGYQHSDVLTLLAKQPIALALKVSEPDDLNLKVVRASSATVEIPELGAPITPGMQSQGYVTNVEGILDRLQATMSLMKRQTKGSRKRKANAVSHRLRLARNGKFPFTLILKDPLGNSMIVSPNPMKVSSRRLYPKELSNLKFGEYAITANNIASREPNSERQPIARNSSS